MKYFYVLGLLGWIMKTSNGVDDAILNMVIAPSYNQLAP